MIILLTVNVRRFHSFCVKSNLDLVGIQSTSDSFYAWIFDSGSRFQSYSRHKVEREAITDINFPSRSEIAFSIGYNDAIFAINYTRTPSRKIELSKLDPKSNYTTSLLKAPTVAYLHTKAFEFGLTETGDVVIVKKLGTSSRRVEIDILSASTTYDCFSLRAETPLEEMDDSWSTVVAGNGDVFCLKKHGSASGQVEGVVLSRESEYKSISKQFVLPLSTSYAFHFLLTAQEQNLFVIRRISDEEGLEDKLEIKLFSSGSSYADVTLTAEVKLPLRLDDFSFLLKENSDILVALKSGGASDRTELLLLEAANGYETRSNEVMVSGLPETGSDVDLALF